MILKISGDFTENNQAKVYVSENKILFVSTITSSKDNFLLSPKMVIDFLLPKIDINNAEHVLKNVPVEISKFNLAGIILKKNQVCCFVKNKARIILRRNSSKAELINTSDGQIVSVTGTPQNKDIINLYFDNQNIEILITKPIKARVSEIEKEKGLRSKDKLGVIALVIMFCLFITSVVLDTINKNKVAENAKQKQIEENRPFFDLSLVSKEFSPDIIKADSEKIIVYNRELNKLIAIDLVSKNTQIIYKKSERENVKDVYLYNDRYFVLIENKLFEIDEDGNQKEIVSDLNQNYYYGLFANNLYELNTDDGKIYRYQDLLVDTNKNKIVWLSEKIPPINTQDLKGMIIDGNIWLVYRGTKIDRYEAGIEQYFVFSKIEPEIVSVDSFVACESCENVYVLERKNKRVVVFSKSGKFIKEIIDNRLIGAKEILVSSDKDLFFDVNQKIFKLLVE